MERDVSYMKKTLNFLKPNRLKLKILATVIIVTIIFRFLFGQYINFINAHYSTPSSGSVPLAIEAPMQTLAVIDTVIEFGAYPIVFSICPHVGDSDGNTHDCGGILPEIVSWTIVYGVELLYMYLLSCLIAQGFSTLRWIKKVP